MTPCPYCWGLLAMLSFKLATSNSYSFDPISKKMIGKDTEESMIKRLIRKSVNLFRRFNNRDSWWKDEPNIPLNKESRYWAKKNGFLASSAFVYGVPKNNLSEWIDDRSYQRGHPYNGSFSKLIDDKTFLPVVFRKNIDLLPKVILSLNSGRVEYAYGIITTKNDKETLLAAISQERKLFAKRVGSSGGRDCYPIEEKSLDEFLNNEARLGRFLVTSSLLPAPYLESIAGRALSTLRVVFYKPKGADRPVIFKVIQRIPTYESGFVDNCDAGGMACAVNLEDGRLGKAIIYGSKSKSNGWHSLHPDTGHILEGQMIPSWRSKLKEINRALENLFFLNYGGLDIADTTEGMKVVEVNSLPTPKLTQLDGPAFVNHDFKSLMAEIGYR